MSNRRFALQEIVELHEWLLVPGVNCPGACNVTRVATQLRRCQKYLAAFAFDNIVRNDRWITGHVVIGTQAKQRHLATLDVIVD